MLQEPTKTIELTDSELDTLMQAMDVATKQGGLQVAQVLLPLAAKLSQVRHPDAQPPQENGRIPQAADAE